MKRNDKKFHHSLNIEKTMTYDIRNPGPGMGQTQRCGRIKLVKDIPTMCVCNYFFRNILLRL